MTLFHLMHDRRGSVAPKFALVAITVFNLIGAAVDDGRANSIKAGVQAATDAPALKLGQNSRSIPIGDVGGTAPPLFNASFSRPDAAQHEVNPQTTPRFVRVRPIVVEGLATGRESRAADPAFKAVLLSTREPTGGPIAPQVSLQQLLDRQATKAPAEGPIVTFQSAPPTVEQLRKPSAEPARPKPKSAAPTRNGPPSARTAPVANISELAHGVSSSSEPKAGRSLGQAEIGAVRAFTRF